jgi:hypothetical protein
MCQQRNSGVTRRGRRQTRSNVAVSRFFRTWSQGKHWPFMTT